MALIDDFHASNESGLRLRVTVAVTRRVMTVMAGAPTAAQQALAKRFMLSPESEATRYVLPVLARLFINGVTVATATDAQVQTATDEVLAVNVTLAIS